MPRTMIYRSKVSLALMLLGAAAGPLSAAEAQPVKKPATYTVKPGDTLFSIARQFLGDQALWNQIYQLNTDRISDPSHIVPGQVLRITAAAETAPVPEANAPVAAVPKPVMTPPQATAKPPEVAKPQEGAKPQEMTKPTPQPERPAVVMEPEEQEPRNDSLFAKRKGIDAKTALRTYREQPYKPLRKGEFFSAGYLTEGESLPFGQLLGSVTPQQIRNLSERATATMFTEVAVVPPVGAQYQIGDSLLIVQTSEGPTGYGEIVTPTGMVRISGMNGKQAIGTVVSVYGPIRNGQSTIPAEKFFDGGSTRAQPVANGLRGVILAPREARELKHPQGFLFIDKGKRDGVARGDVFEVRRDVAPRPGASDTVDELMAVLQVVHVRDRTATVKILNVISPDIPPGTRIRMVGKLPS